VTRVPRVRLLKREKSKVAKRDITGSARIIAKKYGLLNQCAVCSYSLHVDTCHRKAINSFPDNALIQEINNAKNLIGLCKNHHWEFDHGYLAI
jgi:predicted restriction endonuclease